MPPRRFLPPGRASAGSPDAGRPPRPVRRSCTTCACLSAAALRRPRPPEAAILRPPHHAAHTPQRYQSHLLRLQENATARRLPWPLMARSPPGASPDSGDPTRRCACGRVWAHRARGWASSRSAYVAPGLRRRETAETPPRRPCTWRGSGTPGPGAAPCSSPACLVASARLNEADGHWRETLTLTWHLTAPCTHVALERADRAPTRGRRRT